MPLVPSGTLLDALKAVIAALKIDDTAGNDEPLIEQIAVYADADIEKAVGDLFLFKQRLCLLVPSGVRHTFSADGVDEQSKRSLQVDMLVSDRAYFQAARAAVEGADRNLGVLAMGERIEAGLAGVDLSGYGPAVFLDGAPQSISNPKTSTSRRTWIQSLLIPAGDSG